MRIYIIFLTLIFLECPIAQSETHEYPLTAFSGDFGYYTASGLYTGDGAPVSSITLRVTFTIDKMGGQTCVEAPPVPSYYCTLPVYLTGKVWKNDEALNRYAAFYAEDTQAGEITQDLILLPEPGFNELVPGDILQISLMFDREGMCCSSPYITPAEATLNVVSLFIDVTDLVPTERTTWGQIKSIYKVE